MAAKWHMSIGTVPMCGRSPGWAQMTDNKEAVTCKFCLKMMKPKV